MLGVLKTIVARVSFVYAGQPGRPACPGFPVRAKLAHASPIFEESASASGRPAVVEAKGSVVENERDLAAVEGANLSAERGVRHA